MADNDCRVVAREVADGFKGADLDELAARVVEAWREAGLLDEAALVAARYVARQTWQADRNDAFQVIPERTTRAAPVRIVVPQDLGPKTIEVSWVARVRAARVSVGGEWFLVNELDSVKLEAVASERRKQAAGHTLAAAAFERLAAAGECRNPRLNAGAPLTTCASPV